MKVTWEVRRKWKYIPGAWKVVYSCDGSHPPDVYLSAMKVMNERSKGIGKLFQWELRGY